MRCPLQTWLYLFWPPTCLFCLAPAGFPFRFICSGISIPPPTSSIVKADQQPAGEAFVAWRRRE